MWRVESVGVFTVVALSMLTGPRSFTAEKPSAIRVRVIDRDSTHGVKSDILMIKGGKEEHLADTADDGVKVVNHVCSVGEQLLARPYDLSYCQSEAVDCGTPLTFKVISQSSLEHIQMAAQQAEEAKDYGGAALYYNELVARTQSVDPAKARSFEKMAYENTGEALNVKNPVVHDAQQDRDVMSPSLRDHVVAFQKANQLEAKGRLNYPTLSKLSGKDVGGVLAQPK